MKNFATKNHTSINQQVDILYFNKTQNSKVMWTIFLIGSI